MSTRLAFEPSAHPASVEAESTADFFRERHTVRIFIEPSLGHRQKFGGLVCVYQAVVIITPGRMSTHVRDPCQLFADHFAEQLFQLLAESFAQDFTRLAHGVPSSVSVFNVGSGLRPVYCCHSHIVASSSTIHVRISVHRPLSCLKKKATATPPGLRDAR